MSIYRYTLEELLKINADHTFQLLPSVVEIIDDICRKLEPVTTRIRPTITINNNNNYYNNNNNNNNNNKTNDKRSELFGTKHAEEIQFPPRRRLVPQVPLTNRMHLEENKNKKQLETLRSNLNKITESNYKEIKHDIFSLLHETLKLSNTMLLEKKNITATAITSTNPSTNIQNTVWQTATNISSELFEIASKNRFYSKLYASLFAEFMDNYTIINIIFQEQYTTFASFFQKKTILPIETNTIPEKNSSSSLSSFSSSSSSSSCYDELCRITKLNEQRKALACFFINLMELGKIPIFSLVVLLRNMFAEFIVLLQFPEKTELKSNEMYEITEIISLFWFTSTKIRDFLLFPKKKYIGGEEEILPILFQEKNNTLVDLITFLACSCSSKKFPNFTKKCAFKFLDIYETFK